MSQSSETLALHPALSPGTCQPLRGLAWAPVSPAAQLPYLKAGSSSSDENFTTAALNICHMNGRAYVLV